MDFYSLIHVSLINPFTYSSGLVSGIYATNNPETCQYIANDSKANVVIVENDMQLQKFLKVQGKGEKIQYSLS